MTAADASLLMKKLEAETWYLREIAIRRVGSELLIDEALAAGWLTAYLPTNEICWSATSWLPTTHPVMILRAQHGPPPPQITIYVPPVVLPERVLRIEAPKFVAEVVFEKQAAGWVPKTIPDHLKKDLTDKTTKQIATWLKRKKYSFQWLGADAAQLD